MRLASRYTRPARAGFTLVELLVALALTIFIMAILSEAFVKGLEVFRGVKALGDMESKLRTAATLLRRDLAAPHFEGNKRLSECTISGKRFPRLEGLRPGPYNALDAAILRTQLAAYVFQPPKQGFFSIEEWPNRPGRRTMFFEAADLQGRPSYRDEYDVLHFSARLDGNGPDKFFYGRVLGNPDPTQPSLDRIGLNGGRTRYDLPGNNMYSSQAAELLYFLGNDDSAAMPGVGLPGGPVRTFNLYRQSWLLIPDRFTNDAMMLWDDRYGPATEMAYLRDNHVSAVPATLAPNNTPVMMYNTMADVQHRARRRLQGAASNPAALPVPPNPFHYPPYPRNARTLPSGLLEGTDILLTNVISFDVKVWDPFAYQVPNPQSSPGPGRGAYVDIGDTHIMPAIAGDPRVNPLPTAGVHVNDALKPVFGGTTDTFSMPEHFDTGTSRIEGPIGSQVLTGDHSPATHLFPPSSIQITIRVYEPKTQQTRQITIIQDM
jgi:hypothetical protein